jgi:ribulose-phosphate 3-epimerase
MLPKVTRVREEIDRRGLDTELEVDGGVAMETVRDVVSAGARVLVAGTSVYRAPEGVSAAVQALRTAAETALQS